VKTKIEKGIKIRNLDVLIPSRKKSRLRWKEYQILSLLVAKSPELVSRSEIIENIWKGTYCSDSTINQTIKSIRQKIGDTEHTLIRTIPRLGYKVENKAVFHFISEADVFIPDDVLLQGGIPEGYIQEELSEKNIEDEKTGIPIDTESETVENVAELEAYASLDTLPIQTEVFNSKKAAAAPLTRAMKYLTVFVSVLAISYLSYLLGSRTQPVASYELSGNPRLVLSLTLNNPTNAKPQTLICLYQQDNAKEMRIECSAPKEELPKNHVKYRSQDAQSNGNILDASKLTRYQRNNESKGDSAKRFHF
jgi:DNA-binding winged helix-turn-helix (wHTH) protein